MKLLSKFRACAAAAVITFAVLPAAVSFADEGPVAPVAVQGTSHAITVTPVQWTIFTGLLMPIVLALITKAGRSSWAKGLIGIVVAFIAAVVERATLADGSAVFSSGLLLDNLLIYVPQLATYLGLWSHVKSANGTKVGINNIIAPKFGI